MIKTLDIIIPEKRIDVSNLSKSIEKICNNWVNRPLTQSTLATIKAEMTSACTEFFFHNGFRQPDSWSVIVIQDDYSSNLSILMTKDYKRLTVYDFEKAVLEDNYVFDNSETK